MRCETPRAGGDGTARSDDGKGREPVRHESARPQVAVVEVRLPWRQLGAGVCEGAARRGIRDTRKTRLTTKVADCLRVPIRAVRTQAIVPGSP